MQRNASIEIRTRTFTTLANLPNKNGKLTLKIESVDVASPRHR